MELSTLRLLFVGGVLVMTAAILLLALATQRLVERVTSGGAHTLLRPLSGGTTRKPGPASEGALRSHAVGKSL